MFAYSPWKFELWEEFCFNQTFHQVSSHTLTNSLIFTDARLILNLFSWYLDFIAIYEQIKLCHIRRDTTVTLILKWTNVQKKLQTYQGDAFEVFFIFRYIGKVAVAHVLCIWKWKTLMDFGRRRRRFHWKSVVCSLDVALCTVVVINTEGCQNLKFKKCFLLQLNKCETDPYFLQNFQCTTMFISAFCKICELNTEREIVFVFCNVYLLALDNTKR